jgi:hypothetical protein
VFSIVFRPSHSSKAVCAMTWWKPPCAVFDHLARFRELDAVRSGAVNCEWKLDGPYPISICLRTPCDLMVVSERAASGAAFLRQVWIRGCGDRTDVLVNREVQGVFACRECGAQWPQLRGLGIAWATDHDFVWWSNRGHLRCACCPNGSRTDRPRSYVVVPQCGIMYDI